MKERRSQSRIFPGQLDVSLVIVSHVANGKLSKLDPKPSSLLNNNFGPDVQFIFPNENEAAKAVVELFKRTLDIFWGQSHPKTAKEQQLIDSVRLLKNQGVSRAEIVERLRLHFRWRMNP